MDHKDTRRAWHCTGAAATTATTPKEVTSPKTNPDGNFTLDAKFYPLKAFVSEEIYLGYLPKSFHDVRRGNKMDRSTKSDDTIKNKN